MINIDEKNKMIKGSATAGDIKDKGMIQASIEDERAKEFLRSLGNGIPEHQLDDECSDEEDIFKELDIRRCD